MERNLTSESVTSQTGDRVNPRGIEDVMVGKKNNNSTSLPESSLCN
jgi:hypothetical protein